MKAIHEKSNNHPQTYKKLQTSLSKGGVSTIKSDQRRYCTIN